MISLRININGKSRFNRDCAIIVIVGFLITFCLDSASGEYENIQSIDGNNNGLCSGGNCGEKDSGVTGAMWFGPRLGRRRRSGEKSASFDDDQINAIADALDGASWPYLSFQGEKRQTNQFTPRLGRQSDQELIQKYLLTGDNARLARLMDAGQEDMEERQSPPPPPPPFAPRLGRRLPFTSSPRLARRLRALLQKL